MLQAVERERGTIKVSVWALCDKGVVRKINMSQGSRLRIGGCAATRVGWEVTVGVTFHDEMSNLSQKGVGGRKLRHELRARFGMICCQECINDSKVGGKVELKFKRHYKTPNTHHKTTPGYLRFEHLQSIECQEILPSLSM